jgi:hypothetical protein
MMGEQMCLLIIKAGVNVGLLIRLTTEIKSSQIKYQLTDNLLLISLFYFIHRIPKRTFLF